MANQKFTINNNKKHTILYNNNNEKYEKYKIK